MAFWMIQKAYLASLSLQLKQFLQVEVDQKLVKFIAQAQGEHCLQLHSQIFFSDYLQACQDPS